MRAPSRWFAVPILTLAAWVLLASPAQAHALLVSSNPPDGSTLAVAPDSVDLWFSEDISPDFGSAKLVDAGGRPISSTSVVPDLRDPRHLSVEIPALGTGAYGVLWQVLAEDDGHTTSGVIVFSVGASAPKLTSVPTTASASSLDPLLRGIRICLLAMIVGGLGMIVLVLDRSENPADERLGRSIASARRRVLIAALVAAGLAVEVGVTALVVRAHELAGGEQWSDAFGRLLLSTRTGHLWLAFEIALLGVGLIALMMLHRTDDGRPTGDGLRSGAFALVLGLVAIEALDSHAAASSTGSTTGLIAASLHVLTALLWIGALPALVLVLWSAGDGAAGRGGLVRACRGSFSRMAAVSVLVIVVTGLYGAGREVVTVGDLFDTSYGRILLVKVGLLLIAGGVGFINAARLHGWRFKWLGVFAGRPPSRRLIAVEASVGAVILLAAGLLADTPPALAARSQTARSATQNLYSTVEDLVVSVSVTPNRPGVNGFTVVVASSRRPPPAPVDDVSISLQRAGAPPASAITVPLQEVQTGQYFGSTNLATPGGWRLSIRVSRAGSHFTVPMRWSLAAAAAEGSIAPSGRRLAPLANTLAATLLALVLVAVVLVRRRRRDEDGPSEPYASDLPVVDTGDELDRTKEKASI